MSLEDIGSVTGILTFIGALIWGIYKWFPRVKVEITPVADNFYVSSVSDSEKPRKWTHRMQLSVFNSGYNSITFISGELEMTLGNEVIYINMFSQTFRKILVKDGSFSKQFIISNLKLPEGSQLKMIIKDFRGKSYKSNVLTLDTFNPDLNPL